MAHPYADKSRRDSDPPDLLIDAVYAQIRHYVAKSTASLDQFWIQELLR